MNPSENFIKRTPFDLHVLGAPPAFVLSQDQTLNKIVSLPPSGRLRSFDLTQALACVITCVKRVFLLFRIYKDSNVISDIQVDAVQFSRCTSAASLKVTALLYYHFHPPKSTPFLSFFEEIFVFSPLLLQKRGIPDIIDKLNMCP